LRPTGPCECPARTAAGAAAFAAVSAPATASTGSAISALSGAAATSAAPAGPRSVRYGASVIAANQGSRRGRPRGRTPVPAMEGREVASVPGVAQTGEAEVPVGADLARDSPQVVQEVDHGG